MKWKVETSNDGPQMCLLVISQSELRMVGIFGSDNGLWRRAAEGSLGEEKLDGLQLADVIMSLKCSYAMVLVTAWYRGRSVFKSHS